MLVPFSPVLRSTEVGGNQGVLENRSGGGDEAKSVEQSVPGPLPRSIWCNFSPRIKSGPRKLEPLPVLLAGPNQG
eukprot:5903039-Pyramimonas_sp.AAC.1